MPFGLPPGYEEIGGGAPASGSPPSSWGLPQGFSVIGGGEEKSPWSTMLDAPTMGGLSANDWMGALKGFWGMTGKPIVDLATAPDESGVPGMMAARSLTEPGYAAHTVAPALIKGASKAAEDEFTKALSAAPEPTSLMDLLSRGGPEAVAHMAAGALPMVGPAAAGAGEKLGTPGQGPEGAGEALGLILPMLLGLGGKGKGAEPPPPAPRPLGPSPDFETALTNLLGQGGGKGFGPQDLAALDPTSAPAPLPARSTPNSTTGAGGLSMGASGGPKSGVPTPPGVAALISKEGPIRYPDAQLQPEGVLTPEGKAVEAAVAARWKEDPQALVDQYMRDHGEKNGGFLISADAAKEVFPEYVADKEANTLAVHQTARAVTAAAFDRMLASPVAPGHEPAVVLTAGGPGSGKSVSVIGDLTSTNHGVFDTTLSDPKGAARRIEDVKAKGLKVVVIYVDRDPAQAVLNGVVPRGIAEGRGVPIEAALDMHAKANQAFRDLQAKYKGDPAVEFRIVDNTGGPGQAKIGGPDVPVRPPLDAAAKEKIYAQVDALHDSGKVSDSLYRVLTTGRSGGGRQGGAAVGGLNQPGGESGGRIAAPAPTAGEGGGQAAAPPPTVAGGGLPAKAAPVAKAKAPKLPKPGTAVEEQFGAVKANKGGMVDLTHMGKPPGGPRKPPPASSLTLPEARPARQPPPPVPLTRSERTGGKVARFLESGVESSIGGRTPFSKFRERQQAILKAHAEHVTAGISEKISQGPDAMYKILQGKDLKAIEQLKKLATQEGARTTKPRGEGSAYTDLSARGSLQQAKARLLSEIFQGATRTEKTVLPLPYKFGGAQTTGSREVLSGPALRKALYSRHGEAKLKAIFEPAELDSINKVLTTAEKIGHDSHSLMAAMMNFYSAAGVWRGVTGHPLELAGPAALNAGAYVTARLMTDSWGSNVLTNFLQAAGRTGKYAANPKAAFWAARLTEQAKKAAKERPVQK